MRYTTKAIVSGVVAGALIAGAILWFNVPFEDSRVPPAKEAVFEPTTKPADGLLYARTGVDAQIKGDFDQAIKLYSQAIESGDLPREDLARIYNNRGAAFKNTDFYDLAIEDYNAAIRLKKDYARAYYNRATAYHGKGRPELAIKDYDSAIRL